MPQSPAILISNVETQEVDVRPTVAQRAGVPFYDPTSGLFVIPSRDIAANELSAARDNGRYKCLKQSPATAFAQGDTLSFGVSGYIAGADLLEVVAASASGEQYVIAELKNSGGGGGGGATPGQVNAIVAAAESFKQIIRATAVEPSPPSAADWAAPTNLDVASIKFTVAGEVVGDRIFRHDGTDWNLAAVELPAAALAVPRTYLRSDASATGTLPVVPGVIVDGSVVRYDKTGGPDAGTTQWFEWDAGAWQPRDLEPAASEENEKTYALSRLSTDPTLDTRSAAELLAIVQADPNYATVTALEDGDNIKLVESDTNVQRFYEISGGVAIPKTVQDVGSTMRRRDFTVPAHGLAGAITTPAIIAEDIANPGTLVIATTNDQTVQPLVGYGLTVVDANTLNGYDVLSADQAGIVEIPGGTFVTDEVYWQQMDGTAGFATATNQRLWVARSPTEIVFGSDQKNGAGANVPGGTLRQIVDGAALPAGNVTWDYSLGRKVRVTGVVPAKIVIQPPASLADGEELEVTFIEEQTPANITVDPVIALLGDEPTYTARTRLVIANDGDLFDYSGATRTIGKT